MWSDAPEPKRLRAHAEVMRRLDGLPSGERTRHPLSWRAPADIVARALEVHRRPGAVWLDGGATAQHRIAWDPVLTVATRDGRSRVRAGGRELTLAAGGFEVLAALETTLAGGPARLHGYLGYELGAELEELPPQAEDDVGMPDLWLGVHDAWLEGKAGSWTLVTAGERWDASRRRALLERLRGRVADAPTAPSAEPRLPPAEAVRSEPDGAAYVAAVERTVGRIHRGEIFQTNLCRRFGVAAPAGLAWPLYGAMRAAGDAVRGAWVLADDGAVLSRSPECFLRVRAGRVDTWPIKGTRPRGTTPGLDAALRRELEDSDKDRAELAMIVDLARNDLGRVCVPGSVTVAEHGRVLELPGVWHTASRVGGRLRPGTRPSHLLRASFPAASITGAPKIQAMVVARSEEPRRRGPAMGSVGWIDPGGDLELSVAIRTAVAAGGRLVYHAGCGIVADSDPEHEEQESLVKARPFLEALGR